jgi:hypothetical protein
VVNGIVSYQNGREGITIFGGSSVKLRNSYVLDNQGNGVLVTTNTDHCGADGGVVAGCNDNVVTFIDLGKGAALLDASVSDFGLNTLQDSTLTNNRAGLCLSTAVAGKLAAEGNIFAGPLDCSAGTGSLSRGACAANSSTDVGVVNSGNVIDTFQCTN